MTAKKITITMKEEYINDVKALCAKMKSLNPGSEYNFSAMIGVFVRLGLKNYKQIHDLKVKP